MSWLALCSDDPLLTTLREVFAANVVRVPDSRLVPLMVIAVRNRSATFRGHLSGILAAPIPAGLKKPKTATALMADVSTRRSRKVDGRLGIQILDGFLSGFGAKSPQVLAQFADAAAFDFAFKHVERRYVDVSSLGRMLAGRKADDTNPANAIFWGEKSYECYIVDSVIVSRSFTIRAHYESTKRTKISLPHLHEILGNIKTDMKVNSAGQSAVMFEGSEPLAFAFSCVEAVFSNDGYIISLPPSKQDIVVERRLRPRNREDHADLVLERKLLTSAPQMISIE